MEPGLGRGPREKALLEAWALGRGLTEQVDGALVVGDHNVGLRGREVVSPPHLHSDPIQVFDVEQQQTQDPAGSWQGPSGIHRCPLHASVPAASWPGHLSAPFPHPCHWPSLQSSPLQAHRSLLTLRFPQDPPCLPRPLTSCSRHCVPAQHTRGSRVWPGRGSSRCRRPS